MKTILKFSVMVALMLSTVVSMANETKSYLRVAFNAKSMVFQLDDLSKETNIKFLDTNNNVIYSENILNKKVYSKKFNLKNLKEGVYSLKMENNQKVIKYTIGIEDSNVKVLLKKEIMKPIFRKSGDIIYLNLLNLDSSSVYIKVYDSENRLLFEETVDTPVIEKVFNFEKAFEDSYTVAVKNSEDIYYENIIVD